MEITHRATCEASKLKVNERTRIRDLHSSEMNRSQFVRFHHIAGFNPGAGSHDALLSKSNMLFGNLYLFDYTSMMLIC